MSAVPSPPSGPKPGEPGYDDQRALAHLIFNIIKIPEFEIRTGSNEILSSLDAAGVTTFYEDLSLLSVADVMNLEVPYYPGWTDPANPIDEQDPHKISLLAGRRLCSALAYFHYACTEAKELVDICSLTHDGYRLFQMTLYSPEDPLVPYGKALTQASNTELTSWKKTVKLDSKQYKEFKDEAYWNQYKKHFKNTLESHELQHLVDPTHVPLNVELDRAQRNWLYKVMQDNFKQSTCKMIVNQHEKDKDTRAIWKEIFHEMEKSMAAQINTTTISTYLTNTKLAKQGWKGTQTNWIIHYKEKARQYNDIAVCPYSGSMLVQFMENAVSGTPNL
mgnify:FL=1